jgi:hypothetical protein
LGILYPGEVRRSICKSFHRIIVTVRQKLVIPSPMVTICSATVELQWWIMHVSEFAITVGPVPQHTILRTYVFLLFVLGPVELLL